MVVRLLRPPLLAEADRHHLEKAGGDRPRRSGVYLRTAQNDDAVRLRGDSIEMRDRATFGRAQLDGVHASLDRRASGRFRQTQPPEDLDLTLGYGSTVAAHGRDDERLSA